MEEKEVISIGRNRIVDDGFNFYVDYIGMKEKTNVRWTLDHDERAIDYLIEDIKRNGVFPARGCRKGGANIKTVVMAAYRPYGYDPSDEVCLCDGNHYNLRSNNLYVYGDSVPYTQQRRIWQDGRRIWIKLQVRNDLFFTTYKADLYSLLCNTHLGNWFVDSAKRMLYCRFYEGARKMKQISLGAIIWLYEQGKIDFDRIEESILTAYDEMTAAGLQIDHLRDNRRNCCIHNIVAMPAGLNNKKNDIVTDINEPYLFIPVRMGDVFHILCGRLDKDGNNLKAISCDTAEQFVACVKKFRDLARSKGDMLPEHDVEGMTNCVQQRYPDDGQAYYNDQINPITLTINADANRFTPWNGDFSWLV